MIYMQHGLPLLWLCFDLERSPSDLTTRTEKTVLIFHFVEL